MSASRLMYLFALASIFVFSPSHSHSHSILSHCIDACNTYMCIRYEPSDDYGLTCNIVMLRFMLDQCFIRVCNLESNLPTEIMWCDLHTCTRQMAVYWLFLVSIAQSTSKMCYVMIYNRLLVYLVVFCARSVRSFTFQFTYYSSACVFIRKSTRWSNWWKWKTVFISILNGSYFVCMQRLLPV